MSGRDSVIWLSPMSVVCDIVSHVREVLIPASGFAMTEALLVRWYKNPGDHVVTGEAIAEIETDKVTADLESPATGRLGPHLAAEGTMVPVGIPLTHILDETGTDAPSTAEPSVVVTSPAPALLPPGRRDATDGDDRPAAASARPVAHVSIEPVTAADHLEWLETMMLIRELEGRLDPLALAGEIPGGVHLSIGQEAVAVGVIRALRAGDLVAGTHRSHHHAIALGIEPRRIMAELLGKASGTNHGRGGSMHIADLTRGYLGGNGIVGAGIGIAMGAALGAAYAERDQAVVGFVGDGGINTGRTWESANLAAVWRLPLVIVCENNLYAVETVTASVTAAASIAERASAFGMHAVVVDGQDVEVCAPGDSRRPRPGRQGRGPHVHRGQDVPV